MDHLWGLAVHLSTMKTLEEGLSLSSTESQLEIHGQLAGPS